MGQDQVRRTVVWQRESCDDSAARLKNGAESDLSELNYEETAAHWEPGSASWELPPPARLTAGQTGKRATALMTRGKKSLSWGWCSFCSITACLNEPKL